MATTQQRGVKRAGNGGATAGKPGGDGDASPVVGMEDAEPQSAVVSATAPAAAAAKKKKKKAAEPSKQKQQVKRKKQSDESGGDSVSSQSTIGESGAKEKRKRPLASASARKQPFSGVRNGGDNSESESGNGRGEFDEEDEEMKSNDMEGGDSKPEEEKAKPRRGRRRMLHDEEQRKQRRKNQCKLNQRRYRARQRGMISTLSLETDTLTDYIHELEAYQQFLAQYNANETELAQHAASHPRHKSIPDKRPLLVVDQFFHFFQHGFSLHSVEISDIQERFVRFISAPNLISQGATKSGVDALLLQLKRYTSYHAVFEMHLASRRIVHSPEQDAGEATSAQSDGHGGGKDESGDVSSADGAGSPASLSWVIQAFGKMHLRLSRDTVMLVYPHIVEDEALSYRVVGHEIEPTFSLVFQFNEHGKMCKLELMVDFAGAFMKVLNSAEQTAILLGRALISPHCELGIDPHEESAVGSAGGATENKQLSLKFILL